MEGRPNDNREAAAKTARGGTGAVVDVDDDGTDNSCGQRVGPGGGETTIGRQQAGGGDGGGAAAAAAGGGGGTAESRAALPATGSCGFRGLGQRGRNKTKKNNGVATATATAASTVRLQRGLRRTPEELEAKQRRRRRRTSTASLTTTTTTRSATTTTRGGGMERGLRRTSSQLQAKRNQRQENCHRQSQSQSSSSPSPSPSPSTEERATAEGIYKRGLRKKHNDRQQRWVGGSANSDNHRAAAAAEIASIPKNQDDQALLQPLTSSSSTSSSEEDDGFETIESIVQSSFGAPSHLEESEDDEDSSMSVLRPTVVEDYDLVEAMPVLGHRPSFMVQQATQVDQQILQQRETKRQKEEECERMIYVLIAISCTVVAIALAIRYTRGSSTKILTASPTILITSSESPSLAPSGFWDWPFVMEYSNYPQKTPQWQAMDWLSRHPNITTMPEWRMKQLFALAVFFFSMSGPVWTEDIQDDWLVYDKSECLWFSSEFGDFVANGRWEQSSVYNVTPCNEYNEFRSLLLSRLGLAEERPLIPREIALLTSLSVLGLSWDQLNSSLTEILPSEIYQMTDLVYLNFHTNSLHGSIPSELGIMTKIESVELATNHLDGPIPSDFGTMSSMRKLYLHENSLSGPIPSELGLLANMAILSASENALTGTIPSELGMMTSTSQLSIWGNNLSGSIPSEIGSMNMMLGLGLSQNSLTGQIPSQLGLMTSLTRLHLWTNSFSGSIPSELTMMTSLPEFLLYKNTLTGSIPSELGSMTSMTRLHLFQNSLSASIPSEVGAVSNMISILLQNNFLSGTIPTELAMLSRMTEFYLHGNSLTGPISSEFGTMSGIVSLGLNTNSLSGSIPSQLGMLTRMEFLSLENNTLTGTIPHELELLAVNGSLITLGLENNLLSGTIPEGLCSLGMFDWSFALGLSFDCSDQLCGCCWCSCPGSNYSADCQTDPFVPSRDDEEWPGLFPTPINRTNVVAINVRTDDYPGDTSLEWSVLDESGSWEVLDSERTPHANFVSSFIMSVESDAMYRLQIFDSWGDGNCCQEGLGWFTITSSAPTVDADDGSVLWEITGNAFETSLDVFVRIDPDGYPHHVQDFLGENML